jgi:hypothetical protein
MTAHQLEVFWNSTMADCRSIAITLSRSNSEKIVIVD